MKYTIISLILLAFSINGWTQEIKGRSGEYSFNITKDPPKPPYLEIETTSIKLLDNDGNAAINANEDAKLTFTLKNSGMGDGLGLKLQVIETTGAAGLNFDEQKTLNPLKVGEQVKLEIPIRAGMNTANGTAIFQIMVEEPNGFDSDPVVVEIATRAFRSPKLIIADYALQAIGGNRIQKRKPFDIQVLVQNTGEGNAENVEVKLKYPDKMFCLSSNETKSLGKILAGETQTITYNLVTNNEYDSEFIPLKVEISERYGKYGESKEITLEINQVIVSKELRIDAASPLISTPDVTVATLNSAVDKNIPVSGKSYPNRYALIIGNENYKDYQMGLTAEANVAFAQNDASIFRQYAEKTLSIEPGNIFYVTNATAGIMNNEINRMVEIIRRLGSKAELIFYYAGHGFPDENTHNPYLMPVDVSAANLGSAIRLGDMYQKFSETGAGRVVIFLDACFSGGGRESGLLAARSVKVKPRADALLGNMLVFSASTGEQSSLAYSSQKHGIFTYFLLKKLQDTNGNITMGELSNYLTEKVGVESLRINGKMQDPTTLFSPMISNDWEDWLLNP